MKLKTIIVLISSLALVLVVSGCGTKPTNTVQTNAAANTNSIGNANTALDNSTASVHATTNTTPKAEKTIRIHDQVFDPTPLRITVGTVVTWVNNDSVEHAVKSATFSSGTLQPGDKFSYQFVASGTYDYYCSIHPSMLGQVIVE